MHFLRIVCLDFLADEFFNPVWKCMHIFGVGWINPLKGKSPHKVQLLFSHWPSAEEANVCRWRAAIYRAVFFWRLTDKFLLPCACFTPFTRRRYLFKDDVLQNLPCKICAACVRLNSPIFRLLQEPFSVNALRSAPFLYLYYSTFFCFVNTYLKNFWKNF